MAKILRKSLSNSYIHKAEFIDETKMVKPKLSMKNNCSFEYTFLLLGKWYSRVVVLDEIMKK
jgi:hypothetical protein